MPIHLGQRKGTIKFWKIVGENECPAAAQFSDFLTWFFSPFPTTSLVERLFTEVNELVLLFPFSLVFAYQFAS